MENDVSESDSENLNDELSVPSESISEEQQIAKTEARLERLRQVCIESSNALRRMFEAKRAARRKASE